MPCSRFGCCTGRPGSSRTVGRLHPFDWTYRLQAADERAAVRQAAMEFEQMRGLSGAGWVREVVGVEVLPAEGPAEHPSTEAEGEWSMTRSRVAVLGVDLASRSWKDNGSALISFEGRPPGWVEARTDVVRWPALPLSPQAMAQVLDAYALEHGVSALSIDGPQGWRDPGAGVRKGVGRWCEYQARTPGKTGELGRVYPQNYAGWVSFSISVFAHLLELGRVQLVNDPASARLEPLPAGQYWLLECFPSSTWRAAGLKPLPGHAKAPPPVVAQHAAQLQARFGLPMGALTDHHDHLQAVVAALPAAALLGGPCAPVARGVPAEVVATTAGEHRVEGIIWDAA
jgi:hypothetical protein